MYYPVGIFFCDRPSLTPSDKKFGRGAEIALAYFRGAEGAEGAKGVKRGKRGKKGQKGQKGAEGEISKIP